MEIQETDTVIVGIDIGGTFTDFVIFYPRTGHIKTHKELSTPDNPAQAVLNGLKQLHFSTIERVIHGSTVATNALLERNGAKTALITTKGFKDILSIRRQNRSALYDWTIPPSIPLIPPELSVEVNERIDYQGSVIIPLDESEIEPVLIELINNGVQSIAISLIFSFLHPQHEQAIADLARKFNLFVSASSEILPVFREYERTSTTAVNAYVSPTLDKYLSTLDRELPNIQLQVMQSNGGMIGVDEARRNGARCILSGPAGGVVGAQYLAEIAQTNHVCQGAVQNNCKLITFDMGGTSTDVSLIDQVPMLTSESSVGGYPISLPMIDIHTIGAGGGSIAFIDHGGSLRVGPRSAGANPGPACYGKGNLPTVTDANIVLGRLIPEFFMGGSFKLDARRAWKSIEKLGHQIGMDAILCALGIIAIANAHMERALRLISVERGHDPRDFTLFSFGGAGGLHATTLARALSTPRVLISPYASVLSAFGMLAADTIKDYVITVMQNENSPYEQIEELFRPLVEKGVSDILSQGVSKQNILIQQFVDARYQGQSYELTIPFDTNWISTFHEAHSRAYSYQSRDTMVELVNIRLRVIGRKKHPVPAIYTSDQANPQDALLGYRKVIFADQSHDIPLFWHESVEPGNQINGPAMIVRSDTAILLEENNALIVDEYRNLLISIE